MRPRKMYSMKIPLSWVTLVVATHQLPEDPAAPKSVLGFALLEVTKLQPNVWSFSLKAAVADTLADETVLLRGLADALPYPDFLIGELIEADIFAPLADAADRLAPPINAFFGLRLARLQSALTVDLAPPERRAPLPYGECICGRPALTVAVVDGDIVDPAHVRAELEQRALSDWCRFLQMPSASRGGTAGVATMTWWASRGRWL
jgi:hypothetical protein